MHELSIAECILDAIKKELLRYPGALPLRVGVRIGAMAAVDPESLSFCFECVLKGTEWESLQLETRITPAMRTCSACGNRFEVKDYDSDCPACGSPDTQPDGGDELDMDFLEVDTDGTLTAQSEGVK